MSRNSKTPNRLDYKGKFASTSSRQLSFNEIRRSTRKNHQDPEALVWKFIRDDHIQNERVPLPFEYGARLLQEGVEFVNLRWTIRVCQYGGKVCLGKGLKSMFNKFNHHNMLICYDEGHFELQTYLENVKLDEINYDDFYSSPSITEDMSSNQDSLQIVPRQYAPSVIVIESDDDDDMDMSAVQISCSMSVYLRSITYPFFTLSMRSSYINKAYSLPIPFKFCSTNQVLRKGQDLRCCGSGGWEAVFQIREGKGNSKCAIISCGWCQFVIDNSIKEGDECIFELTQKYELNVHIIRG